MDIKLSEMSISSAQNDLKELLDNGHYRAIINKFEDNPSTIKDPSDLRIVGVAYFLAGRFDKVSILYEDLYPLFSSDSSFVSLFGASLRRSGLPNKSLEVFKTFIDCYPESIDCGFANNYANLLIDLKSYDQALHILGQFDNELSFNRDQIKQNIQRVIDLQMISNDVATNPPSFATSSTSMAIPNPLDPLSQAFGLSEVLGLTTKAIMSGRETTSHSAANSFSKQLPDLQPADGVQEILSMIRTSIANDPQAALDLCKVYYNVVKPLHIIYQLAGDAYILQKKFADAQRCFLHYLALGGQSFEVLVNLCSLAQMSNNPTLASHYYDQFKMLEIPEQYTKNLEQIAGWINSSLSSAVISPAADFL